MKDQLQTSATVRDEQSLEDFIRDLRQAARDSRRSGGAYSACLVVTGSGKIVERVLVNVWLPAKATQPVFRASQSAVTRKD